MAGNNAIGILIGAIAVTVLLFALLAYLLRKKNPFTKHRADALAALEGGSISSTETSFEKPHISHHQAPPKPRATGAARQMSIPSIVMTASLAGPGIAKPEPSKLKPSTLRQSTLSPGGLDSDWKELGLPAPPSISDSRRGSRTSKAWSILSVNGWKKRNTVRLTYFAM
ncbi:hypothetical protein UCRPC4_g03088 [Phaeomoniella chlamydospora]|uniref:Uncharacterized protein n=1 Tax=Phaeomoniella chlamydospora TaxID=158046 RepID=A0A0G2EIU4_PHACM|nr:hypothetical protein UCRPC4_g03088 [Phaeomoniella chlamydospora]